MKKKDKRRKENQGHFMSHRTLADMHVNGVYFDQDMLRRQKQQNTVK